ncbi:MAG: glycosyltransferase family 87 protein [Terracidiphilus sp.]|nr:glycosyltransferase family 87 protein [Terracidiphilus sp.]
MISDSDFAGYYTAACLVSIGQSTDIYAEATQDVDPTVDHADPNSVFARNARAHGLSGEALYDYPPTLADLLTPLSMLSPRTALIIWELTNLVALFLTGVFMIRMLAIQSLGAKSLVLAFLVLFRPTISCLSYGQIAILLTFLLTAGLYLYSQGRTTSAGFFFALAVAIKLIPLIVIVPFLAWRDWKILRAMALWCAAILIALLAINGRDALSLYFLHELPKMGTKAIDPENRSIGVALQILWRDSGLKASQAALIQTGKLLSILVLGYAGWLSRVRYEKLSSPISKIEIVSVFLLFSCCLSPVSWSFSYVLGTPALIMLGKRSLEKRSSTFDTMLLILFVVAITTATIPFLVVMTSVIGVALGVASLLRLNAGQDQIGPSTAVA